MAESRANRVQDVDGGWRYLDDNEVEFIWFAKSDADIIAVDDFIDGLHGVTLPEETISMLLGLRQNALLAHNAKSFPLMEANLQGLHMACRAAGMLDAAKAGVRHSKAQSEKAKKPRVAKTDSGETTHEIIKRLATAPETRNEKALQLWSMFYGELDRLGLAPILDESSEDPRKWRIEYIYDDRTKPMTFGTFANHVSRYQNEKSR